MSGSSFKDKQASRPRGHVQPAPHSQAQLCPGDLPAVQPDIPATLILRETAESGRSLFAGKQGFKAGSKIITTTPLVSVLDNKNLALRCSRCFLDAAHAPGQELSRCSGCQIVHYCSTPCQRADWSNGHKDECKAMQERKNVHKQLTLPDTPLRAIGRVVFAAMRNPKTWQHYTSMQSHWSDLKGEEQKPTFHLLLALSSYVGRVRLRDFLGAAYGGFQLVSRFQCNTFTLTSPQLDNIGVSISPLVALLNHSCEPNAVVVFPNFATGSNPEPMQVRAIRDIAPGEEILTSYADIGLPRRSRQHGLRETYRFSCKCPACTRPHPAYLTALPLEWSLWCDRDGSTKCPFRELDPKPSSDPNEVNRVKCPKCANVMSWTETDRWRAMTDGSQALDEASAITDEDPETALTKLLTAEKALFDLHLGANTFPLMQIRQEALVLAIQLGRQPVAYRLAFLARDAAESAYPPFHPVRGIASATLAKITVWGLDQPDRGDSGARATSGADDDARRQRDRATDMRNRSEALLILALAKAELIKAFGEDSVVVKEAIEQIAQVSLENAQLDSASNRFGTYGSFEFRS